VVETVTIESRFRGPPDSANGGYACGLLARRMDGAVEVTLRKPPPLDEPLEVEVENGGGSLLDGNELVAAARTAEVGVEVPEPVSVSDAEAAAERFTHYHDHPFPTCFVCGPGRAAGDGLRIFPGAVGGREIVAAAWTPDGSFANQDGSVLEEIVWGALDCPTSFGGGLQGEFSTSVLGRLTGRLVGSLEVGRPHVVIGWPIGADGRKWEGGSALFTDRGELKAYARGLWIELKK
jgi:hypothetical protein